MLPRLLSRSRVAVAVPGVRPISTTNSLRLREMFREVKDMGFAPRFRDQHTRMIAKRPDPKEYYVLDQWTPLVVMIFFVHQCYKTFRDERVRDLDRMLEYQFAEIDDVRMEKFEKQYAEMLAS